MKQHFLLSEKRILEHWATIHSFSLLAQSKCFWFRLRPQFTPCESTSVLNYHSSESSSYLCCLFIIFTMFSTQLPNNTGYSSKMIFYIFVNDSIQLSPLWWETVGDFHHFCKALLWHTVNRYLIYHQFFKFSNLQRLEMSIIFIIGVPQMWRI